MIGITTLRQLKSSCLLLAIASSCSYYHRHGLTTKDERGTDDGASGIVNE